MKTIESKSKDSLEDLDKWHDVTEKVDIPERIINSYILYKTVQRNKNEKALTYFQYRKMLVDRLIGDFLQNRTKISTSISEIRLNGKIHIIRKGIKRDCVVCSKKKEKDRRCQKIDYYDTSPSKLRMYIGDCFQRYHTMANYKI